MKTKPKNLASQDMAAANLVQGKFKLGGTFKPGYENVPAIEFKVSNLTELSHLGVLLEHLGINDIQDLGSVNEEFKTSDKEKSRTDAFVRFHFKKPHPKKGTDFFMTLTDKAGSPMNIPNFIHSELAEWTKSDKTQTTGSGFNISQDNIGEISVVITGRLAIKKMIDAVRSAELDLPPVLKVAARHLDIDAKNHAQRVAS